jgi:hypothetical protein
MEVIPFTRKRYLKGLMQPAFINKMIQLTSEVKYNGLTLDKGWTSKKQLDNAINKPTGLFGCAEACLDDDDTKGGMLDMLWLRPIVTYTAKQWWPTITLKID